MFQVVPILLEDASVGSTVQSVLEGQICYKKHIAHHPPIQVRPTFIVYVFPVIIAVV
jgi:hypothetical protein